MSDSDSSVSRGGLWLSVAAIIGAFLVFAVVLYLGYLPSRTQKLDPVSNLTPEQRLEQNILTPEERKARLEEMHNHERQEATTYGWIDQQKGIVRLPLARAMELTVKELQQAQARAAAARSTPSSQAATAEPAPSPAG